jgi:predicted metal-dependent HD superfamily phosphohydrolase
MCATAGRNRKVTPTGLRAAGAGTGTAAGAGPGPVGAGTGRNQTVTAGNGRDRTRHGCDALTTLRVFSGTVSRADADHHRGRAGRVPVRTPAIVRPVNLTDLRRQWSRTIAGVPSTLDDSDAVDRAGADLLGRWTEPHRAYHNATHLTAVLSIVDKWGPATGAGQIPVALSAWFHDAVYDPRRTDNEEASARLAERVLAALGLPSDLTDEVCRLVRLTAGHDPPPGDRNGALLSDADLAILAAEPDRYDRYAVAIRREYAHVPGEAYRAGRAAVLDRLSGLPALFRVVPPRTEWEARARANLGRELSRLRAG